MQSRCWNAEVMQSVDADMSALWTSFPAELMTQLESVKTFVETTCGNLRTTALSGFTSRRGSGDDSSRAMRTLAATVQHQLLSLLFDLDNLFENFFNGLDALRTDSLSSIRTAFLGQLMEDSYHEANMEHGKHIFQSVLHK